MLVLKFGGSSVATAENVKRVIEIVRNKIKEEPSLIVVASAFGGITNLLDKSGEKARSGSEEYKSFLAAIETRHMTMIEGLFPFKNQGEIKASVKMILNELEDVCFGIFLLREMNRRVHDRLLSFGERLSGKIISEAFRLQGIPIHYQDARELMITEENWERRQVDFSETQKRVDRLLKSAFFPVYVPGFIASTRSGIPSTLGRGGSDYTAALLAAMTGSRALEIWTDVDGVMTADPALVESAMPLSKLSYSELMEMSHFGAKVVFPPSIQPVMKKNIPVWIKNTFHPEVPGTLIDADGTENGHPVKGLSHVEDIVLLTITGGGMVGVTGTAARLFSCLSQQNVNVIFITQASSEHSITLAVSQPDAEKATKAIENEFAAERKLGLIDRLLIENGLSIVALVGDKMKSSLGLSGKAFDALGKNGINIRAIAQGSTEKNVSFVVKESDVVKTLNVLHERFFLSPFKKVHLFMVGVGNVGSALLGQIQRQYSCLKKEYALEIKVMAVANSRLMAFDDSGIELENWKQQLVEQGIPMNKELFVQKMKAMNLRNSIFVDNTASHSIALLYEKILKASISVVASNKIAASGSYSTYKKLNDTALSMKKKFLYETNVGAGLPVLKTIRDMRKSGDKIFRIQAVLSGSLNFIFNHFTGETPFSEIVKLAGEEGYTEPDPRIDLSGQDVMRKILILARESGYPLEPDEVSVVPFLPEYLMKADSVEKFMEELEKQNDSMEKQRQKAEKNQKKLRYVAEFNRGKAQVGLQMVGPDQPYYQLDGKDNIVLIFSQRYDEQPLVIKGAGAGAAVTASGVFADIISIVNQ